MYIYGKNVAIEAIKTNQKILKAYLYKNSKDTYVVEELKKKQIKIEWLDKKDLDHLCPENHQGIVLRVPEFEYNELDDITKNENSLIVILDHLEDPHNFGAIIRTCEAAGVDGIIIPKDRGVSVNPTVIKVSTGATRHMKIVRVTNLVRTMKELKEQGFWIVGTDMEGTHYKQIDYQGKIALVIGNEGKGMSDLVSKNCDFTARIPMVGTTNSLNASVAAGIMIYEAMGSRGHHEL